MILLDLILAASLTPSVAVKLVACDLSFQTIYVSLQTFKSLMSHFLHGGWLITL